jgi:hypothetical protein
MPLGDDNEHLAIRVYGLQEESSDGFADASPRRPRTLQDAVAVVSRTGVRASPTGPGGKCV